MERQRIFYDGQDLGPSDFNSMQDFAQASIDHAVGDGITAERKYAGFQAAATGVTTMTVQPGRLYSNGMVFARSDPFEKDFTSALPVNSRRIVLLVAYGQEQDTNLQPRQFLINQETNQAEPRVVAQDRARVAIVNTVSGEENADPVPPIVDVGALVVATIVLSAAGIESVTMSAENKLDSNQSLANRAAQLEAFRTRAEPQIGSLASDISALTKGQARLVGMDAFGRSLLRLATIEEKVGIPEAAVDSGADFFLDDEESDLAFAQYSALIEDGVRFPTAAQDVKELQIFDPYDGRAKVIGNVLLPAYSRTKRMGLSQRSGEIQISTYTYSNYELVQKTPSRSRIRVGPKRIISTSSAFWQSGKYNGSALFRRNGETFVVYTTGTNFALGIVRIAQFWSDRVEEPYWDKVLVEHQVPGASVAETFLQSNDMWLDAVGLTFTRLANAGSVTVAICETDRGMPMLERVISKTTIERGQLKVGSETQIPVQPVFLTGGMTYALVVITTADHWLATSPGTEYPQGTFFYVTDGVFQQGETNRDIMFSLYAANFGVGRAVIQLKELQLAGGIADLDILAETIVPGACELTYEVQIAGKWHPLDASIDLTPGGNAQPLLPLRAVFTGTPDVMPAITLAGSQVKMSNAATAFTHVSKARTLAAPSDNIRVIVRLEAFEEAPHNCGCTLLTGAGFATTETADSIVDVVLEDGTIERTFVFDLAAPISTYRIRLTGATTSALDLFHIASRKDYAL